MQCEPYELEPFIAPGLKPPDLILDHSPRWNTIILYSVAEPDRDPEFSMTRRPSAILQSSLPSHASLNKDTRVHAALNTAFQDRDRTTDNLILTGWDVQPDHILDAWYPCPAA